jgi:hypothetical protein
MTHRVDAAVDAVQDSQLRPPPNRVMIESEPPKLTRGDDTVLPFADRRDRYANRRWAIFVAVCAT